MSYMQFQQQCQDCGDTWNAEFGMVGTTQIASPPKQCPYCGSSRLTKVADGWGSGAVVVNPQGGALCAKPEAVCPHCDELRSQNAALQDQLARSYRERDDSINTLSGQIKALRERNAELEAQEKQIRKALWMDHGHIGLYGDDGEMQCSIGGCMLDFKRNALDKILVKLLTQFATERNERDRALSELAEVKNIVSRIFDELEVYANNEDDPASTALLMDIVIKLDLEILSK